ncbi:MAG: SBBP repeat-containing protein [Bacteroidetes bacterium]|nr:SBBP repeat-containing protein [Bacteroidota bacterium]
MWKKQYLILIFLNLLQIHSNAQTLQWAKQLGGKNQEIPFNILTDSANNTYISGAFVDTCDMDPSSGVFNLISKGINDIFSVNMTIMVI